MKGNIAGPVQVWCVQEKFSVLSLMTVRDLLKTATSTMMPPIENLHTAKRCNVSHQVWPVQFSKKTFLARVPFELCNPGVICSTCSPKKPSTCLALLFGIGETIIHRHFYGTLQSLAAMLEASILWPRNRFLEIYPMLWELPVSVHYTGLHWRWAREVTLHHVTSTFTRTTKQVKLASLLVCRLVDITFMSNGFGGKASKKRV